MGRWYFVRVCLCVLLHVGGSYNNWISVTHVKLVQEVIAP